MRGHHSDVVSERGPTAPLDDLAAQSLRRGVTLRLRAHGDSMLPFLRGGDLVVIRPAVAAEVRIGDVICYEPASGGLCLHRVIAREERGFVTRGDALAYVETVPDAWLLGVVRAVERHGRVIPTAQWRGRILAVIAPAIAPLVPLARALRRAGRAVRRG
jgi:hypothetical protein